MYFGGQSYVLFHPRLENVLLFSLSHCLHFLGRIDGVDARRVLPGEGDHVQHVSVRHLPTSLALQLVLHLVQIDFSPEIGFWRFIIDFATDIGDVLTLNLLLLFVFSPNG